MKEFCIMPDNPPYLEIWKDIPNYEGLYQVSNLGNIKSLKKGKNKLLKFGVNNKGYYIVNLYKNNKGITKKVHRLVAQVFIPNPNNYPIINHKDENKKNNIIDNLEWCDNKYNLNYGNAKLHRIIASGKRMKPIIQLDINNNKIAKYNSIREASRKTNINRWDISNCLKEKQKSTKGFKWRYIDEKKGV